MRKFLVLAVILAAVGAEAVQKYWYPVGRDEQGRTTYRSSIRGSDGLYYPDPDDSNIYVMGPNTGPTQEQLNWLVAGSAVNSFQQDHNKRLQREGDLLAQEQALNRVLDRQRNLDAMQSK